MAPPLLEKKFWSKNAFTQLRKRLKVNYFTILIITVWVTWVTLSINQHDYAFSAMVTLEGIVLWNNQPDRKDLA